MSIQIEWLQWCKACKKNFAFGAFLGRIINFFILNFVVNRKADNIIWGIVSNCILWWQTKKTLVAQEELFGSHRSSRSVIFFPCHNILQFETILFYLGLLYKKCQTQDVLISVLYIAAKPKWRDMVLPMIQYILKLIWEI